VLLQSGNPDVPTSHTQHPRTPNDSPCTQAHFQRIFKTVRDPFRQSYRVLYRCSCCHSACANSRPPSLPHLLFATLDCSSPTPIFPCCNLVCLLNGFVFFAFPPLCSVFCSPTDRHPPHTSHPFWPLTARPHQPHAVPSRPLPSLSPYGHGPTDTSLR
jgi:hypothetical protein